MPDATTDGLMPVVAAHAETQAATKKCGEDLQ